MTAIAPPAFIINETSRFVTPTARTTRVEQDRVLDTPQTVPTSPWRAPLFYLSFVAAALLLVAVAIILAWRMISGLRRG